MKKRNNDISQGLESTADKTEYINYLKLIEQDESARISRFISKRDIADITSDLDENGNVRLKLWGNIAVSANNIEVPVGHKSCYVRMDNECNPSALKDVIGDSLIVGVRPNAVVWSASIPNSIKHRRNPTFKKKESVIETRGYTVKVPISDIEDYVFNKSYLLFDFCDYRFYTFYACKYIDKKDKSLRGILIAGQIRGDAEIIINGVRLGYKIGPDDIISKLGMPRLSLSACYNFDCTDKSERGISNIAMHWGKFASYEDSATNVTFDFFHDSIIFQIWLRR